MLALPPVHRWLAFDDSWTPNDVERLLNIISVRPGITLVYDPFVGCGTTAVVCAQYGLRTFSVDIDPLAALTTRMKLSPPSVEDCRLLETIVAQTSSEKLLRTFAAGKIASLVEDNVRPALQFLLCAALLRVGWHTGVPLVICDIEPEIRNLLAEFCADSPFMDDAADAWSVICADYRTVERDQLKEYAGGHLIMLTSPPFFGSNLNPARQRLAQLLDSPVNPLVIHRSTGWENSVTKMLSTVLKTGKHYNSVVDYLWFIDQLLMHASEAGCYALALEMGSKYIDDVLLSFDQFVVQRLSSLGYVLLDVSTFFDGAEPITTISAQRSECATV